MNPPQVVVAATTTVAAGPIVRTLSDAGYVVRSMVDVAEVLQSLRHHPATELLVLDGVDMPSTVGAIIDSVRAVNWALPIILISPPEPTLRAEAELLGVEAILESPVTAEEIRRVAKTIVPVVPDIELDLAG